MAGIRVRLERREEEISPQHEISSNIFSRRTKKATFNASNFYQFGRFGAGSTEAEMTKPHFKKLLGVLVAASVQFG
ncbi:hypothetical protein LB577_33025, partial [Mesorhizobium sp. B283B1A]|uniref:hypothetical protein n=1 Tax=Mesorhizobium sp. B283B1A TaxID=2876665 RepID=UPI001CD18DB9